MWPFFSILLLSVSSQAAAGHININEDEEDQFRIINGKYTSIREIPWQVAQIVPQPNEIYKLICGGAIISMNKILTAGHCIKEVSAEDLKNSIYRAGSSFYDKEGSIHHIHSYVVHPRYKVQQGANFYLRNDIAVVKVKEPFIYSATVQPIMLHNKMPPNFALAQISGWGIKNPYVLNSTAPYLMSDRIPALRRSKCLHELGINILMLPKTFFCLGKKQGEVGACFGDSGGPVTIDKKLVGVLSATFNMPLQEDSGKHYACGFKISATVVQSVATYLKWIRDTIRSLDELALNVTQPQTFQNLCSENLS